MGTRLLINSKAGGAALHDLVIVDGDADRSLAAASTQLASPGDGGIEQFAVENHVVLGQHRHHEHWQFRAMGFVHRDHIGKHRRCHTKCLLHIYR